MKRNFSLIVLLTLLFGGLLSACDFPAPAAQAPDLNGSEWQLTMLNGVPLPEEIRITLSFQDGQAGGQAPCNGYGASYAQDGNALTFDQVVSTLMYCEDGMDYEAEYLATFELVKSFQLENDVLTLLDETGAAVLVFGLPQPTPEPAAPSIFEGSEWQLTSLNGVPLPEKIRITLRFENGEARGHAACNTYGGPYSQDGDRLTFDQIGITEMGCEDDDLMTYEANYMAVFVQVKSFQWENDVLSLLDENGAVILVYSLSQLFTPRPTDEFPLVISTVIVTMEPPTATKVPSLRAAQVRGANYRLSTAPGDLEVNLDNGKYQSTDPANLIFISMSELIAFGDLNGDGLEDAATLVGENYGGSGVFVFLVIYLNEGGRPVQAGVSAIDDRANIQALSIQDGQVIVEGLIHGFSDPGCCPSMPVMRTYRLVGESLVLLQQIQVLEDGSPRTITITAPAQESQAADSVRLTGEVTVSPFENNLVYVIYDAQNNELARGPFAVTSDGVGGPGTFDNTISLDSVPAGQAFRIELQDVSMADGSILALAAVVLYR